MPISFRFFPFLILSKIPWRVGYLLSDIAYFIIYYAVGYRKKVVRKNLALSFPELPAAERLKIERNFYKHLCELLFESIKLIGLSKEELMNRMKMISSEKLDKLILSEKQIILYSAHLGNWEWYAILPEWMHRPVFGLYLPLSNVYFDALINQNRQRFGIGCIPAQTGYRGIMQQVRKGIRGAYMIIGDQSPPRDSKHYYCRFLNQHTAFTIGAETMAEKMKAMVFFPKIRRTGRGYYEMDLICLWDGTESISPGTITQRYADALENSIREQPENWL